MADTQLAVTYTAMDSTEISIDKNYVNMYLLTGGGSELTDADTVKFFNICKIMGANPLINDIWPMKVGDKPATFIISKQFQEKRADLNPNYDGCEHGVIVQHNNGDIEWLVGACVPENVKLIGGWATAYRKDRSHPIKVTVPLSGYLPKRMNEQIRWYADPAGMIEKVAYDHALREAFPNQLGGVYGEEEMDQARDGLAMQEITAESVETVPEKPAKPRHKFELTSEQRKQLQDIAGSVAFATGETVDAAKKRMTAEVGKVYDADSFEAYLAAVTKWRDEQEAAMEPYEYEEAEEIG